MVALVCDRIFDGTGAPYLRDGVILVEGERIAAVGRRREVVVPPGARVVRAEGKTVMPGLVDAHVHVSFGCEPNPTAVLKELLPYSAIRAAVNARRMLEAGITTIRSMGSIGYADVALRQAIEDGLVVGPRVLACGHMLLMTGADEDGYYRPEVRTFREGVAQGMATGADEVRRAARIQLYHGADFLKVFATGRAFTDGPVAPAAVTFTEPEMRAAVEEAHHRGKRVAAHAYSAEGITNAVRAGVDTIEHASFLDEETAALMAERGVALVPTFSVFFRYREAAEQGLVPRWALDKTRAIWEHHGEAFRRALAAGVAIGMGTDCGEAFVHPGQNAKELELMVDAGMKPEQALVAATKAGAEIVGLGDRVGTLEPGKLADLIVVGGDPLADISILQKPEAVGLVMKDGKVVAER